MSLNEERERLKLEREQLIREKENLLEQRQKLLVLCTEFEERRDSDMSNDNIKSVIGTIEPFTEDEEWSERFFVANDIREEKMASCLLTLIGKNGYALLKNLCLPVIPSWKTYEELLNLMKNHLQPPPSEITERYKFEKCVQNAAETISAFCTRLKKLLVYCTFGQE